jgi:hypothetical protein
LFRQSQAKIIKGCIRELQTIPKITYTKVQLVGIWFILQYNINQYVTRSNLIDWKISVQWYRRRLYCKIIFTQLI